jgi:hypothetical protein
MKRRPRAGEKEIKMKNELIKTDYGFSTQDDLIHLRYDENESDNSRDWYDVYVNGHRVGSAPCDPGYSYEGKAFDDLFFYDLDGNESGAKKLIEAANDLENA